jgi:hypothetical protein
MGNIDFSAGAVLTAAQLNDIGDWKSWTPTLTNWTKGSATVNAKYMQIGETVWYQFYYLGAADSAYTTGGMRFSLPPIASNTDLNYQPCGVGWARPNTGSTIFSIFGMEISETVVLYAQKANLTFTYNDVLDSSTPATWQTSSPFGDIFFQGWYKSV